MKKIIAMLLCVALVAAMGVSAFAGTPAKPDSKTEVFSVKDWYDFLKTPVEVSELEAYALALGKAKAALNNELDAYNKGIKTAALAVQAAQYATVGAYVNAATELYAAAANNAINEALAEFQIELENALKIPASVNVADIFWPAE